MKQVIVMRTDLNMRKGKMIAQGAHAAMLFLIDGASLSRGDFGGGAPVFHKVISDDAGDWIENAFTKVCVRAESEEELLDIAAQAKAAGIECHVVTDSGRTEFGGTPTKTCLALGPDKEERIDAITGDLKLL